MQCSSEKCLTSARLCFIVVCLTSTSVLVYTKVFDAGKGICLGKGEEVEVAKKDFIEVIKTLEKTLGDKDFFGGDTFGFVDIIGIAMTSWFPAYEKYGSFKLEDDCPKFSAWIKRSSERESVAKVIPEAEKVLGFMAMFRKMMGVEE